MKNLADYPSVAAFSADLVDYDHIYIPGTAWNVSEPLVLSASHLVIDQFGPFVKDPTSGVHEIVRLADGVKDIDWRNPRFNGNRQAFTDGFPVPAILGHRNENIRFRGGRFENLCDVGIKLRQVWGLDVECVEFDDLSESGVENRWYENDPRTGQPWSWLPAGAGNVSVTKSKFFRIGRFEDITQGTTLVDGCGMTADNTQSTRIVRNVAFNENYVEDCLRGFFTESILKPVQGLRVRDNDICGSGASGFYTRAGIGIIGADDFDVTGNKIRNIGNHVAVGTERQGIVVSGPTINGRVIDNTVVDTRTSSVRMEYGININQGSGIEVRDNRLSNASVQNLRINWALCPDIITSGNRGAPEEHSWRDTFEVEYYIEQLAAGSNWAILKPSGWGADPNTASSSKCALVAASYRLTAPVSAGGLQIAPFVDGSSIGTFLVNEGSFSGGQYASKKASLQSAPMVGNLSGLAVRYTSSSNFAGGGGAYVKLVFDRSRKI